MKKVFHGPRITRHAPRLNYVTNRKTTHRHSRQGQGGGQRPEDLCPGGQGKAGFRIATPDGRQFYIADVEEHFRPSDDLLRDHYRQCVLACMKATAGPVHSRRFDPYINLGPGGFSLEEGSWWSGPEGKEQMEVELAARLHHTLVSHLQKKER